MLLNTIKVSIVLKTRKKSYYDNYLEKNLTIFNFYFTYKRILVSKIIEIIMLFL